MRTYHYEFRTLYMDLAEEVNRKMRLKGCERKVFCDHSTEEFVITANMTAEQKKSLNDFIATLTDGLGFHRV